MHTLKLAFALVLLVYLSNDINAQGTRLLRHPTVSRDSIAFEYAGDLWVVSRSGGTARRLTSTPSLEIDPYFSPDGSQIAFLASHDGQTGIWVTDTNRAAPKLIAQIQSTNFFITYAGEVFDWSPDSRRIAHQGSE